MSLGQWVALFWSGAVKPRLAAFGLAARPQLLTVLAFALFAWAATLLSVVAGLVVLGLCLLVLDRKLELERRSPRDP